MMKSPFATIKTVIKIALLLLNLYGVGFFGYQIAVELLTNKDVLMAFANLAVALILIGLLKILIDSELRT